MGVAAAVVDIVSPEEDRRPDGLPHPYAVSLDLDAFDTDIAPGVGTPVMGGLSYREGRLLMETLAEHGGVSAVDIVEVNPILDSNNATAELAVELCTSLLGKQLI